ncbi:MAG: hypothetical protein A3J75_00585 [Acidobacteria bacterium RBG_16_68_9]|nr:MAG: hypothetical protein A3J75_00585 [Acidobacteria bacterium RBG_16_68_9]
MSRDALTGSVPERPLWRRLAGSPAVQLLLAMVVLGGALVYWIESAGGVTALRDRFGLFTAVIVVPVHAIVAISPFPSEVIAFGNGVLYGVWKGTLLSWLGWMLAAGTNYALVRRAAADVNLDPAFARLPRWLRRFPVPHPIFLIAGRWIPYGPQLISTAAGAFRVPFWRFCWCTGVSIAPVALFFAALASGLLRL